MVPATFSLSVLLMTVSFVYIFSICVHAADGEVEFDYSSSGLKGPEKWGTLSPKFKLCSSGKVQSPVNIPSKDIKTNQLPKDFKLPTTMDGYKVTKEKNSIKVSPIDKDVSGFTIGGKKYTLAQWHIHAPGEHKVDKKSFAAEIHYVYTSGASDLAVIGVFVTRSATADSGWTDILKNLPKELGKPKEVKTKLAMPDIAQLEKKGGAFVYTGSLTTPPCTEGVKFHILKTPMSMSDAQLKAISRLIGFSARPIQANTNVPSSVKENPKR